MQDGARHWSSRLPFYYGWLIVGIAFVTMAIGVTARTAFSLLLPPLISDANADLVITRLRRRDVSLRYNNESVVAAASVGDRPLQ